MSSKILILGSNPSIKSPDDSAFHPSTKSGKNLMYWLRDVDASCYDIANISGSKTEQNKALKLSDIDLLRVRELASQYIGVVALGNTVDNVLQILKIPHFAMEHPSGLNRNLNDLAYVDAMIHRMKSYIKECYEK